MKQHTIKRFKSELTKYIGGNSNYTLAPEFYTDPAWLNEETEHLLKREWHCLGRVEEVSNPGDFFTLDLLGEPLLVVCGKDKNIRVLANVCRHRNMPVAEGHGRTKSFVCPYHAWSYQLDGSLLRAPFMEDLDASQCALPELSSEIWQGFIFVNLSTQPEPLASRLSGLDHLLANYHSEEMHHVFVEEDLWPANWKCLLENFMEGYHLSRVHPQTLGGRTPTKLCEKFPSGVGYTGYRAHYPSTAPGRGLSHPDLTESEINCSTLFCVYPGMVASQAGDILVYMALQPMGVDEVRIRWGVSVYDASLSETEINNRIQLWREINAEDKAKLGKLQMALYSQNAIAGPLAPDNLEGTIRDFHGYLSSWLAHAVGSNSR